MMGAEQVFCYVGVMPGCGCAGVVTVDKPEYAKDTAKTVAQMVRDGLEVKRMTVEEFRAINNFGCAKKLRMKECAKGGQLELSTPPRSAR